MSNTVQEESDPVSPQDLAKIFHNSSQQKLRRQIIHVVNTKLKNCAFNGNYNIIVTFNQCDLRRLAGPLCNSHLDVLRLVVQDYELKGYDATMIEDIENDLYLIKICFRLA